MGKYIDADAFALGIGDWQRCYAPKGKILDKTSYAVLDNVIGMLDNFPSADVPDRNVGRWIPWKYHNGFRCEHCNEPVDNKHNFCPNCGADMRGERNGTN